MSLVDYASSSEEDEDQQMKEEEESAKVEDEEEEEKKLQNEVQVALPTTRPQSAGVLPLPPPMIERLPDASLLFSSPSFSSNQTVGTDHSSRVAAAMAESESRKRNSNGSAAAYPRSKLPRGRLPHSRNIPDTRDGLLVPPQLRGRSNVVTEDISKLFVKKDGQNLHDGNETM